MLVYHLEPEEFILQYYKSNSKNLDVCPVVLNCGIAGMIYSFKIDEDYYYLDRLYVSKEKKEEFDKLDKIEVHAEIYRKFCLDHRMRLNALMN